MKKVVKFTSFGSPRLQKMHLSSTQTVNGLGSKKKGESVTFLKMKDQLAHKKVVVS